MNDVLYAIYDSGINKTKELKKKFKIVNLTSATESGVVFESRLAKKEYSTHGTDVLYAVINRLQNLEGYIDKDWVKTIIDKKITFVDSHPYSLMSFGFPEIIYQDLKNVAIQKIRFLKQLTLNEAVSDFTNSPIKTFSYQYLANFTNISIRCGLDLNKKRADLFSKAIDANFTRTKQPLLITAAGGNKIETSPSYECVLNNRHVTTIGINDADYGSDGANVFASDCGTFFSPETVLASGTSFASPGASSIGILVHQINPSFNWHDYQNLIANSVSLTKKEFSLASFMGDINFSSYAPIVTGIGNWNGGGRVHTHKYGFGYIDAEAWLLLAASTHPGKAKEKIVTKQLKLTGTDRWSTVVEIKDNIEIEHITVDLNAPQQYAENITLFMQSPQGVIYPILKPHATGKQTPTNFTFLAVAARGEKSAGFWTLIGEGPAGSAWGNFEAGVNFYGVEIIKDKREDINFTNDIASSTLQEIDEKNGKNFADRLTINNRNGEKRINCAAIYPNDLGDGKVKIDLNSGAVSNINGQVVKIDSTSQSINAAYGGGSHDVLIGNQYNNELAGGPGDDYLDGGFGKDSYEISSYPFSTMSNHDVIDIAFDDYITRKGGSVNEMLFYQTSQGQIFGLLGYHDTKRKVFSLSQNDSICLNLVSCSPDQIILKDDKKTYSLIPLIVSYNQGKIKRTVTLWRPKASDQPPVVWLPHDAKNVQVSTSPTSKPLSYLDIKKAKFKLCSFQFLKTELVGTLSSSSQKEQYQGLLNNLLVEHGFKIAAKTEDPKINKENQEWIGEKADLYLNLDQDLHGRVFNNYILVKDILTGPSLSKRFDLKNIESIVINEKESDKYIQFKNDLYAKVKQTVFSLADLEKLQFDVSTAISNLSIKVNFKNAKPAIFNVRGSRQEWVNPATYKGYVYEQLPLTTGVVLSSEQNYQGYYHIHIKLDQNLPTLFALMGLPLEKIVTGAKLDRTFTVTNTTLKITKFSEVEGGDVHLHENYGKIHPTIPNIQKDQEVTLEGQHPAVLLFNSKIQEKDFSLAHIVKISNGDTHLMITTSVGLDTKPAPFDLKGFLVAHNLAK